MSSAARTPFPFSRRNFLAGAATVGLSAAAATALPRTALAAGPTLNLASNAFDVRIDQATGAVFTLANPSDRLRTNFVMNDTWPAGDPRLRFAVDDSRWTGDMIFHVRRASAAAGTTMVTGLSDDIRRVTRVTDGVQVAYSGSAANPAGIKGFALTQSYVLTGAAKDRLTWSITLRNTSAEAMEFQDIGFPVLMNSWWNGGDQTAIYEQNVSRHSFVGKDGSYVYWQRPNGYGPYLVMVPSAGTGLEFKNKARYGEGPYAEVDPEWEGVVEFYLHSKNVAQTRTGRAAAYLPSTSLTLAPGQEKTYSFTFRWAGDYRDLRDVLHDAGVVDVVSLPGMVVPRDLKATLAVRARDGITGVVAQDPARTTVTARGTRNGYNVYELTFAALGPSLVTVRFGTGRESVLQYNAISPVEELVAARSTFLTTKQQVRNSPRGYNGAYLQWDMARQKLITWDDYPGGGWKVWMAGGSDDLGLGPAVFLTEKNLQTPVQAEIDSVDYYIEKFILGYMQTRTENGQRTYQVYRWFDGSDGTPGDQGVWRVYNYIHIANTYYNMYAIRKNYPALRTRLAATDYLDMCFRTLEAMYTKVPLPTPIGADPARHLGLMGEMTYPDILTALDREGRSSQAQRLRTLLEAKRDYLFSQAYPFASEASIDTTGFEANYTLAKMYGNRALADKTMTASLACRGLQPQWYFYGSDNRHMGESWWNLGYEAQLGAWQQQDYLLNYTSPTDRDFDDAMRSTYGAYLGGWANINTGQIHAAAANSGAASWQFQSEKGPCNYDHIPILDGWWAWSGEADLGFWGGLRAAAVNVVDDDVLGVYAYGGDLTVANGIYSVVPRDGVRTRLTVWNLGLLGVGLTRAKYTRAEIAENRLTITLTVQNVTSGAYTPTIALTNLPSGNWTASVGNQVVARFASDGKAATVDVPSLSGATTVVRLARV